MNIYNEYRNNPATLDNTKLKAFSLLGRYTEHWSDYEDIDVDNSQRIRIMITYVDPVLLQYIVLNNTLSNNNNLDGSTFDSQLKMVMDKLAQRNELLFVVTVTASSYGQGILNTNALTIRLPGNELLLISSNGTRLDPTHTDPILNENITITNGPVSGIVSYPIALSFSNNDCTWIMDHQWNNTITLSISSVTIGTRTPESLSWSIPYNSFVIQDVPITVVHTPTPVYDGNSNLSQIVQQSEPPPPNWTLNATLGDSNWKRYWEYMGLYLWYLLVPLSYP